MKRTVFAIVAMVAALIPAFAEPVKEAEKVAHAVEAVNLIVTDGIRLYHDLRGNAGVSTAVDDVVMAYGHAKAALAVLEHGHHGRVAAAAKELEGTATSLHSAYEALADDDKLQDARHEATRLLADVADLVYVLRGGDVGSLGESCSSRCSHECSGLDVAACALNCVHGNSCHPSCCGCKDGTAGCDACGSSCSPGDVSGLAVSCEAG